MLDPKSLVKLRPCGKSESMSTVRHHLGFYNNVASTASYSRSNSTIPLETIIFYALRKVILQHPILSAIPLDEDKHTSYFARLPSVDLRTCVNFVERQRRVSLAESAAVDPELDAILSSQHNEDFKSHLGERPFWRIIIIHSPGSSTEFTLSWVYHHALGDGSSGSVFHRSFLAALQDNNTETSELNAEPIVTSPSSPLLPNLEQIHPLSLSVAFLMRQQWNGWFPKANPSLWLGNKIVGPKAAKATTHFKSLVLSKEKTNGLLESTRRNYTSMTATVQCLIAASTFANLDEGKWDLLRASVPISVRRFLTLDPEQESIDDRMGVFVSEFSFDHQRRGRRRLSSSSDNLTSMQATMSSDADKRAAVLDLFSWTDTQSVKQAITLEVAKGLRDSAINLLRWVPDLHQFFQKKVGVDRGHSFEFSNVGVVKTANTEKRMSEEFKDEDQWKLGRCVFSQCPGVTGAAFSVSAITGPDGCMVLGFSWLEGVVQGEWIERVMAGVREGVEGLLYQNGF